MTDQAAILRQRMDEKKEHPARVIAVVSGKGGVGKSVFCVNFMAALNEKGKKTIVIDLDVGMGNVEFLLGSHAKYSIMEMVQLKLSIWEVITESSGGLSYIAGGSGLSDFFSLSNEHLNYFFEQLEALKNVYSYIVLDFGAGITRDNLNYIMAAHEVILVTTPEPTSLTDAYSTIKYIHMQEPDHPVSCVINQLDDEKEGRMAWHKLQGVSKRFLQKDLNLLTTLPWDKIVVKSVKQQMPYLLMEPHAKISVKMKSLASSFTDEKNERGAAPKVVLSSFISRLKHFLEKRVT
jgi:flagellar biosynthesis protein FlhG